MPRPRTSISPASAVGRAHQQAAVHGLDMDAVVGDQPGEREQAAASAACSSASASRDLPEPDGPRISTARAPTSTAEAWMVGVGIARISIHAAAITSPAGAR